MALLYKPPQFHSMHKSVLILHGNKWVLVGSPAVVLLLAGIGIPALDLARSQHGPLPLVLPDNVLDTANVVSGLSHVVQSCPPGSLLLPLDNLDALDVRRVNLVPHLDADSGQLVAEQDGGINTRVANVDADTGKGVA